MEIQYPQFNRVGVEGANNIAAALKINETLTTLILVVRFFFAPNAKQNENDSCKITFRIIKSEIKEQLT